MQTHRIVEAGPRGEKRRVVCMAHPGCTWQRELASNAGPQDAIILALVNAHVTQRLTPTPDMMGHPRRPRSR